MNFTLAIYGVINGLFVLLISPLFISVIKKVKAYAQGRKGPSPLQTYRNLFKLPKKETVYSKNSSWIMRVTP
jgi:formate hydrogenlyase subunit 4